MRIVAIPHGKKMAVKDLPNWNDLSDPPLTDEAKVKARELTLYLLETYGHPLAVFQSSKLRCRQTAEHMVANLVDPLKQDKDNYVPLYTLGSLAQTDNGDSAPDHPDADEKGLVYYGPRSDSRDWYCWTAQSLHAIKALTLMLVRQIPHRAMETVYVYTHRPIVAGMRWIAQRKDMPTGEDDIDALDTTLLPYCVFNLTSIDENMLTNPGFWLAEIPRPRD